MSLVGKRVLVTRAEGQASALAEELAARGAIPWVLPAIEIVATGDPMPAITPDWIIFTSSNAVREFAKRGVVVPSETRFAAVGPTTATAVRAAGWTPEAMPKAYLAAEIVGALGEIEGKRFLLPRGDLAREDLPRALQTAGAADVVSVEVYRTIAATWPEVIEGRPDLITFTSSSGVLATHERLAERGLLDWLSTVPIACIGPVTAQTLRDLGFAPIGIAQEHTIPGLLVEIVRIASRTGVAHG